MRDERDTFRLGFLSWMGLFIAAVGWALMLAEAFSADVMSLKWARIATPTFHADLFQIAECLIGSGFGLAVIGCLQNGFGALNRFFGAVLDRSLHRNVTPPSAAREDVPERRPYRLFPDGSVEVETIVGTRRFGSMAEARDFI